MLNKKGLIFLVPVHMFDENIFDRLGRRYRANSWDSSDLKSPRAIFIRHQSQYCFKHLMHDRNLTSSWSLLSLLYTCLVSSCHVSFRMTRVCLHVFTLYTFLVSTSHVSVKMTRVCQHVFTFHTCLMSSYHVSFRMTHWYQHVFTVNTIYTIFLDFWLLIW